MIVLKNMTHLWEINETIVTDIWKWLIYDSYVTVLWHIYDTFMEMTVLWQIYDRYMTHLWNWRDLHSIRVPKILSAREHHRRCATAGRGVVDDRVWRPFFPRARAAVRNDVHVEGKKGQLTPLLPQLSAIVIVKQGLPLCPPPSPSFFTSWLLLPLPFFLSSFECSHLTHKMSICP